MPSQKIEHCLALLGEAENLLARYDEGILAAHLSLVSARLRGRRIEPQGRLVRLG